MTSPQLIAVGASLGGLDALTRLLTPLPRDLPIPIAIVQHRTSESQLAAILTARTGLEVVEPDDQAGVEPGRVYLAPPNYHLIVEGLQFELSIDELVNFARPSIDVLFESVADSFGERAMAVLLTGASDDGAAGLAAVDRRGGITVVQDPDEAESPIAPRAALELIQPTHVLPLNAIAGLVVQISRTRREAGQ